MLFKATFNKISVILCQSVLLVEDTGTPGENHRPAASHWQTLSHNGVSSTPHLSGFDLTTLVVIYTDCIGSYKSNYHMITTTTALYTCISNGILCHQDNVLSIMTVLCGQCVRGMYNKLKEMQGLIPSSFLYHGNISMVYIYDMYRSCNDYCGHIVHVPRAVLTALYTPGQSSALGPIPTQPLTGIKL
jgi:hypothetical protein